MLESDGRPRVSSVGSVPTAKLIEAEVAKLPLDIFIRPASGSPAALSSKHKGKQEELIPGLRGWLGTLVSRHKVEAEAAPKLLPESSSIADRISRDFGLLGSAEAP